MLRLQDLHIRDVTASLKVCTCSVLPAASSHRTSVHDPNIHLRLAQTRSLYARRSPAVHLHLITRCYSSMLAATRVNSRIYPHIPAHTSAYPRVLAHTRAHSRILAHTRAYPRIPAHTRAYQRISRVLAHTRAHSRILAHTRAYSRIPAHTRAYSRILAHARACPRILAHTSAYPRVLTHTRAHSRILAHTRAYSRIPAHTRAYPRIPAHTCAYPRIPAHTRAYPRIPGPPQAPCPQSRFPATVKDVSLAGIHTPTWAIRADNPSRHLRVLASRIPLPSWFWLLQQGRVDRARALLDAISDTNRALARWALFGAVARSCATSAVPISSFRTKAEQGPQGSSGFGNRQSDSSHCSVPDVDVREIHRMGFGGVHAHSVVAPDCSV